jgi:hypothetical protein
MASIVFVPDPEVAKGLIGVRGIWGKEISLGTMELER